MITFEEFFLKKKIDLHQLQQSEPVLYAEFQSHYALMGEKSFDHTKKYWFNKLRRLYHIKEEPKAGKPVELSAVAAQAEPLDSPAKEIKPAYTPRFKPKSAVIPEAQAPEDNKTNPNPVYKPSFKPGIIRAEPAEQKTKAADLPKTEESAKPAYKPRFKPQPVKPAETIAKEDQPEKAGNPEEETKKPAYKPRFNPKNTKPGSGSE